MPSPELRADAPGATPVARVGDVGSPPSSSSSRPEEETTRRLDADAAVDVLRQLKALDYDFVPPTNASHKRVLRRREKGHAASLRDVLGWNLPFSTGLLPPALQAALQAAGMIEPHGELLRARARVARLGDDLFIHGPFPPTAPDAVFFGPDTYRFARFLRDVLAGSAAPRRLIDLGAGSGAGGVVAARLCSPERLTLTDVNPSALRIAKINLRAAGLQAEFVQGEGLAPVEGEADLIIANPPFMAGSGGRAYRDGGDLHGARLSLNWALTAMERLAMGGRLVLYTGSAIIAGNDPLREHLQEARKETAFDLDYSEIDPDIFGEQLTATAYQDADRIAAVGVVMTRR